MARAAHLSDLKARIAALECGQITLGGFSPPPLAGEVSRSDGGGGCAVSPSPASPDLPRKRGRKTLPFGLAPLDAAVGGGLRLGALHEIVGGEGQEAAATLFLAGLLARLEGPVLWVARARDIFAPGLANAGLHPDRVLYAQALNEKAVLAVLEEGLRHGGLAAVVGEVGRLGLTASRRLQLAAETTGTLGLILRRRAGSKTATEPNAALTRWRVSALPSAPAAPGVPGLGPARWHLALERCRGGEAQSFIVEVCDAKGRLGLSAPVGDGSIAPAEPRAAAG